LIRDFDNTNISRSENRSNLAEFLGIQDQGTSVEIKETVINTDQSALDANDGHRMENVFDPRANSILEPGRTAEASLNANGGIIEDDKVNVMVYKSIHDNTYQANNN
jgi:hypothetical protein